MLYVICRIKIPVYWVNTCWLTLDTWMVCKNKMTRFPIRNRTTSYHQELWLLCGAFQYVHCTTCSATSWMIFITTIMSYPLELVAYRPNEEETTLDTLVGSFQKCHCPLIWITTIVKKMINPVSRRHVLVPQEEPKTKRFVDLFPRRETMFQISCA